MSEENQNLKIGVGVMIFKDGKVLIGKRKNRHGDGEYSFCGGGLDYMQSFEDCAKQEVLEEAGIKIKNIKFLCLYNETTYPPRHTIMVGFTADWESGEPQTFPDERVGDWNWYEIDNIPEPFFIPAKVMVNSYKLGINFYDKE